MTRLVVEGLSVARGGRTLLSGLSFAVGAGEAVVLTGPNGVGKTTLIRTVAGFLSAPAGSIRLEGGREGLEVGQHCHLVGHLNAVRASLSVRENLAFWQGYLADAAFAGGQAASGGEALEAALERLALAGLAEIPAGFLSAGQRRRLALARLQVAFRPLWLLDEPTVSLDAASQGLLAGLVGEHLRRGGLVLAATHVPLGVAGARELPLGGEGRPS